MLSRLSLFMWGLWGHFSRTVSQYVLIYLFPPLPKDPQCALPFGASSILNGAVICEKVSEQMSGVQQCRLICRQGFHSAYSSTSFQCDLLQHRWVSAAPLYQACQSTSELPWVGKGTEQCKWVFKNLPSSWSYIMSYNDRTQLYGSF